MTRERSDETSVADRDGAETPEVLRSNRRERTNIPATMTPSWLARDMVSLADVRRTDRVLEPSAGTGNIVRALNFMTLASVTAVELNAEMAQRLKVAGYCTVTTGNFLKVASSLGAFDRVVMNPPLNAIPHVVAAAGVLKRGGRLVSLVHRETATHLVEMMPGVREYLIPPGTFVDVDASLLVWDKL